MLRHVIKNWKLYRIHLLGSVGWCIYECVMFYNSRFSVYSIRAYTIVSRYSRHIHHNDFRLITTIRVHLGECENNLIILIECSFIDYDYYYLQYAPPHRYDINARVRYPNEWVIIMNHQKWGEEGEELMSKSLYNPNRWKLTKC